MTRSAADWITQQILELLRPVAHDLAADIARRLRIDVTVTVTAHLEEDQ